jgi:acyl dehydratase
MALLTPEIEAMVGQTVAYTAPEPFGAAEFRYFALAVGDTNPIYTDDAAARSAGYAGVTAPVTFVTETNQYMSGETDEHGYGGHSWGIEIAGTRMIRGGHDYEFGVPVKVGDVMTVEWTVVEVEERTSRAGAQMLEIISEARYWNQDNELLAVNREKLIFQELT